MLRLDGDAAAHLAQAVAAVTDGNPYETVELLNGLRREGVLLMSTATGWRWDPSALDQHLKQESVTDLMGARVDGMPAATRRTLEAMACLGSEVELATLEIACGLSADAVEERLTPALDDGLLVMAAGLRGARFHHDRLREIVLSRIPPHRLGALRL